MSGSPSNKRIAYNTIYMYIRLAVTLVIGLYSSRVVLLVLGISDYGLFNVVGGILAMFTFISGSLSGATSRFFNVEMGKAEGDVNRSYNINLVLHIALAVVVLILAETIGLWYIYNKLRIEPGQFNDALFVYHVSIFTACLGIINGPCSSLFTAFERFGFLAKFDIINTLIRAAGVFLLQYYRGDALRFYTILMSLTTINTFVVFYWIAIREWSEIIRFKFVKGWQYYREVLSFGGWNLLSTLALMARSTGSDLIINHFFNTALNGAFAVSKTVNNYITTFSTNFDSASGPQIIQSYSAKDYSRSTYLVNKLGRFCILLFELAFFPLYIELDFILHLWLKEVPPNVLVFCKLNLLIAAVALTCGGLVQIINASGKIKWFKINGGFFFVICLPVSYILYKHGAPSYAILVTFLIADILQRAVQLILMKTVIGFDSKLYIKEAYGRPVLIAAIMTILLIAYSYLHVTESAMKFVSVLVCFILTSSFVYLIGLTRGEKNKIREFVCLRFSRFMLKISKS